MSDENQDLQQYFNELTCVKLRFLCRVFSIPTYGIKPKLINKLIKNNITSEKVNDLIIENNNKQYLIECSGCEYDTENSEDDSSDDGEVHVFFCNTQQEGTKFCAKCNKPCTHFSYENEFYNYSKSDISKLQQKTPKERIPATIRNIVWDTHVGKNNKKGTCFCCTSEDISFANFHCGHIISAKNGGKVNIENLRPICAHCNSSIGTQNMSTFMEKYGLNKKKKELPIEPIEKKCLITPPKALTLAVWLKYGKECKSCFIGCGTKLTQTTFFCGLLEIDKGQIISNIRPLCKSCFDSTQEVGINVFMKQYDLSESNEKSNVSKKVKSKTTKPQDNSDDELNESERKVVVSKKVKSKTIKKDGKVTTKPQDDSDDESDKKAVVQKKVKSKTVKHSKRVTAKSQDDSDDELNESDKKAVVQKKVKSKTVKHSKKVTAKPQDDSDDELNEPDKKHAVSKKKKVIKSKTTKPKTTKKEKVVTKTHDDSDDEFLEKLVDDITATKGYKLLEKINILLIKKKYKNGKNEIIDIVVRDYSYPEIKEAYITKNESLRIMNVSIEVQDILNSIISEAHTKKMVADIMRGV